MRVRVRLVRAASSVLCLALGLAAHPAAAQVPAGGEFAVNTHTPDYQESPAVAYGNAGNFVIFWASTPWCPLPPPFPPPPCNPAQDGDGAGVFARRFDPAGGPMGSELQVNVQTVGSQSFPSAALLSNGRFVVVWVSQPLSGGTAVVGRMLDSSGTPVGDEFIVSAETSSNRFTTPDVAALPSSEFVVLWRTFDDHLLVRRFDAFGSPLGAEIPVSAQPDLYSGRIAADGAGNFMVVWTGLDDPAPPGSRGIFARRFDRLGAPLGTEFQVNSHTPGFEQEPDVAADADGNFFVAWRDERLTISIHARRFDPTGSPLGPDFPVGSSAPGAYGPVVAASRSNEILVAWPNAVPPAGSTGILGRRYDRSGVPGPEFRADTSTFPVKFYPAIGFDGVGNFAVAWRSDLQDGSRSGVFGRRYGGLQPVGMTVDPVPGPTSDGNGVFEPDETVPVEPAWSNVSSAVMLPFSGTASSFTGPPGSLYEISDGGASYPVVSDGATARCRDEADCYRVGVGAVNGRPSVHWDAVLREDIGPNAPDLSKAWRVHLGGSFDDVARSSGFYRFVEAILHHSVTGGCTASAYCPAASTSREQMAVFALVSKEGAGYAPAACGALPMFGDVPAASPFCRWIEELARRGVVGGCGGGNYCPGAEVTREQMAIFALRTLEGPVYLPPACGTPIYADVPAASPFCPYIEELTRRSVVGGCGNGNYCPAAAVSREQMSVFLAGTFGLQLYGP